MDPMPPKELIVKAQWNVAQYSKIYFLNTTQTDMEKATKQAVAGLSVIHRKPLVPFLYRSVQTLDLSLVDGMLFQYCE